MKQKLSALLSELTAAINSLIHGPSLREIMNHEYYEAGKTVEQSMNVIRRHEYIKHMAKAKMQAIDDWNAGNIY